MSFLIDILASQAAAGLLAGVFRMLGAQAAIEAAGGSWDAAVRGIELASLAVLFALVPALTRGQTLGQKLLKLRCV